MLLFATILTVLHIMWYSMMMATVIIFAITAKGAHVTSTIAVASMIVIITVMVVAMAATTIVINVGLLAHRCMTCKKNESKHNIEMSGSIQNYYRL